MTCKHKSNFKQLYIEYNLKPLIHSRYEQFETIFYFITSAQVCFLNPIAY